MTTDNPRMMPRPAAPVAGTFFCPHCDAERPPIVAMNTIMPLNYVIGKKEGQIQTLRSIVCCGACGRMLNVQFLPVDLETGPVPSQPVDDGSKIIV